MKIARIIPWATGVLALLFALASPLPTPAVRGFDVNGFGRLPVLEGGRVKPLDSIARNALLVMRSKQSVRAGNRSMGPDEWILSVVFKPQEADALPVFVIDDPEVLGLLGLQQSSQRYFSFEALAPHIEDIQKQAEPASSMEASQRSRFQSAVVALFERLYLYHRLRNTLEIMGSEGLASELRTATAPESAARHEELIHLAYFRPLPPLPGEKSDNWHSVGEMLRAEANHAAHHPALASLAAMSTAYRSGDAIGFNQALSAYRNQLNALKPEAQRHADREELFNRLQPFYTGMVLYVLAALLIFVSWIWKPELLRSLAFSFLVAGAIVHTGGLFGRVILQGRPPVTNLYSSAIFVGWGAVILGVILERIYKRGFGTAVAAIAGFASLLIAHHLSSTGDTMEMMRAVLDSNFWLATHVVTITIGYSATFLAGAIAIGYTIRKHIGNGMDADVSQDLSSMVYGVICFGLFFSFVGTVLGGIWADQSWGRFWGWDPKENGALLIVLWNAIILHARWAGYAKEPGVMAMAIFGNIITSFSWFGVNMLGVGLHSYGFMDSAFQVLAWFIVSQLLLIGACLLPNRFWALPQRK